MNQPPAKEVPPIVKVSEMLREDAMTDQPPRDAVVRARKLVAKMKREGCTTCSLCKLLTELADECESRDVRIDRLTTQLEGIMNCLATSQQERESLRAQLATTTTERDKLGVALGEEIAARNIAEDIIQELDIAAGFDGEYSSVAIPETMGERIKSRLATTKGELEAAREEVNQRDVNRVAANLDGDDFETFTALVLKSRMAEGGPSIPYSCKHKVEYCGNLMCVKCSAIAVASAEAEAVADFRARAVAACEAKADGWSGEDTEQLQRVRSATYRDCAATIAALEVDGK